MSDDNLEWKLYICRACGLIYDEKEGDPDSGLLPGTRFEDIPDDWECPLCRVKKTDFELFERPVIDAQAATFNSKSRNNPGIVIIGGGIAGWSMAEAIRLHDTQISVTIITACSGDLYHKPELSVAIGRKVNEKGLVKERGYEAAQRLAINLLANTFVVGLSAKTHIVRTTRGSVDFSHMVLAQGAESRPLKNIPPQWCWRINHLKSWSGLEQKLKSKPQRIAIIGGGMIGCELAENLRLAGHEISLIYRSNAPLNQLLPNVAGQRVARYLQSQGIECIPNAIVEEVTQNINSSTAKHTHNTFTLNLSNQSSLNVDHIVTATGLQADRRLPKIANLHYKNGIEVNERTLETSQKNVYALGDCISIAGQPCHYITPISQQAKVISAQILGLDKVLYNHENPIIRLKVQACSLVLHGQPIANANWKTIEDSENNLCMEQWNEGVLVSTLQLAKAS